MFVHDLLGVRGSGCGTVSPEAPIIDALDALRFEKLGALVASWDGRTPDGLISEREIVTALHEFGRDVFTLSVQDAMSKSPFCCKLSDLVSDVVILMWRHKIHFVPAVGEKGDLAGCVSYHDVLEYRYGLSREPRISRDNVVELRTTAADSIRLISGTQFAPDAPEL